MSYERIKKDAYIKSLERLVDELVVKKSEIKADYNYILKINELNKDNVEALENEVADLETRLKEALEGKSEERNKYIQSSDRVEELENEIGDLYNKYLKAKEEKVSGIKELDVYKLYDKYLKVKKERDELQADYSALFDNFNNKCESNEYLNKYNEQLEREKLDLESNKVKLIEALEKGYDVYKLKVDNNGLRNENDNLKNENHNLREEVERLKGIIDDYAFLSY